MKRPLFSIFLSFVLCIGVLPARAQAVSPDSLETATQLVELGDWLQGALSDGLNAIASLVRDDFCYSSPNHRHDFQLQNTSIGDDYGTHYVCQYCRATAPDVFSSAYSTYTTNLTTELGTTTLSDGTLIYPLIPKTWTGGNTGQPTAIDGAYFSYGPFAVQRQVQLSFYSRTAPFTGNYAFYSDIISSNANISWNYVPGGDRNAGSSMTGSTNTPIMRFSPIDLNEVTTVSGICGFVFTPATGGVSDLSSLDISPSSRPTVITGPVGYYDTSNNLQVVNDTTIVNETNNSYYNPVTNTTSDISYWSYDYSDRSYHLTLATGDTATVTYGDEYIVIQEGNVIYNIYYVIQGGGSGEGGSSCNHNYTSAVTTEPGCTTKGITTYTCDLCGHKYTEYIDALGHDWQATEEVPTTYALPESAHCPTCQGTSFTHELNASHDEYTCTCSNPDCGATWAETPVTTYGHTIYTCSRCGATQKDSEDPDSGLFTALGNFLVDGIDWIVDKLVQLIDSIAGINEIFTEYVEQMKEKAGEYPAFISAFIAIMPEDLMTVVWFGVIAAVVLAVWKKWFN